MNPTELSGKTVSDTQGIVLGEIAGIEIDLPTWKVTHLCINLSDDSINTFGYQKRFLGKVQIDLPTDTIQNIGDIVILNQTIIEIKDSLEPHEP